ncbi:MAG: glycosyltransferase family 4 protein [Capsulimonadaceae bacterium]|nr:glycosyltransferase family 4 protein [Capsulimonadaceae bacterium]
MTRVLLAIPSVMKRGIEEDVAAGRHPTMDYDALTNALLARGASVECIDYQTVAAERIPKDVALALRAYRDRCDYDVIFTNGENVSIPLALLLKTTIRRPRHVTIGHRLSAAKKRPFFTLWKAHRQIDRIFVYAATQYRYAVDVLGIPEQTLALIPFHADTRFFRPDPSIAESANLVSAAGLEWRDYDTLIAAASRLPDVAFSLAAASPWSKHRNATENRVLPPGVSARRYEYGELRALYAASALVAVPLIENDFQAGVTTILEAMAMGKPVVTTATTGQKDVIVDGETGFYVSPGDVDGWIAAIDRLRNDDALRRRVGGAARAWIEEHASLDKWAATIAGAILSGPE